ncbi:MAG: ABC transporter substrate-binding protein [Turicibacter sp.]
MTFKKLLSSTLIVATCFLTVGCSQDAKSPTPETKPLETTESVKEPLVLNLGLMPAVDTAPILLAQENGYFEELGLNVTIEIYTNAENRQSALQTNQIDGAMTDLIALAVNNNGGFTLKATTMTDGMFPVLENPNLGDKKDIKVGMMEVSVSNFLIDEWLGADYNIEKVYINEIPARLAAIASGDLDMGLFPEPVASNGELQGLTKKVYETKDGICPDVIAFTEKALTEKEEEIKLFHQGYNKAVDELNNNKEIAKDLLINAIPNVNPEAKDLIVLPTYHKTSLPSDEYITKIIDWTSDVLNKELTITAADLVEGKFNN